MSPLEAQSATGTAPLTQMQRVTNAFVAPSKTFQDIKRGNKSWWLPFIVLALVGYIFFAAFAYKVGVRQSMANVINMNPKAQEQMAQATPEQREKGMTFWVVFTEVFSIGGPVIGLVGAVVTSAVLLGTINFGFGGKAKFGEVFAMSYYAWLPSIVKLLLGTAVMWFQPPEQFNIQNFAPTNAAALFMDPATPHKALYALATHLDIIQIWMVILFSIGLATVAGVKRSSGYIAVFGWWVLIVLAGVGWAAAFG
jgi:hypothetical protein